MKLMELMETFYTTLIFNDYTISPSQKKTTNRHSSQLYIFSNKSNAQNHAKAPFLAKIKPIPFTETLYRNHQSPYPIANSR